MEIAAPPLKPATAVPPPARLALLPHEEDLKKSITLGRYQFRRDGAGWECREISGKGAARKRPYLAYLSRAAYLELQRKTLSKQDLERSLLSWADRKREEKWNGSLRFEQAGSSEKKSREKA